MRVNKSIFTALLALCLSEFLPAQQLDYSGTSPEAFYAGKEASLIIVNYWATDCAPCKQEMKDLEKVYQKYKGKGLLIIGASIDPSPKADIIKKAANSLGIHYPILYGLEAAFKGRTIATLPTTFILDGDGALIETIDGKESYSTYNRKVEEYLVRMALYSQNDIREHGYRSEYYSVESVRMRPGQPEVELRLRAGSGFHLNGSGYPPITIDFGRPDERTDKLEITPSIVEAAGLETGATKIWIIKIDAKLTRLSAIIKAVACDASRCIPIEEKFVIDIE